MLSLVALTLMAAACGSSSSASGTTPAKAPYTIAYISDLTGGNSTNSLGGQAGFNTAVKEINDAGGAGGHMLVVQTYDSQSSVTAFQAQLRQALGTNPTAIAGQWLSGSTAGAASVFASANVPVISASYIVGGVASVPYWLSTSPLASGVATGAVNGIKGLLGGSLTGKKIAFEGLISPAVDANLAAITSVVQAGGGTVGPVIRDPISFSSWASQAANVANAHPDAVITNNTDGNTVTVVKALAVAGLNVPMISTEGANSDALLSAVKSSSFYVVRETVTPSPGTTLYSDALAAGASGDRISQSYFGKMYAAGYIISNALSKCGDSCTTTGFVSALKSLGSFSIPNNALAGPVDFSKISAGLTTAQVWDWDSTKNVAVAKGSAFSIVS